MDSLETLLAEARAGRFDKPPANNPTWPLKAANAPTQPIPKAMEHATAAPTTEKAKVARRADGKRAYLMDFINDKQLYAAVMFAREKMREGYSPDYANGWAARVYSKPMHKITVCAVAKYTGQCAGTVAGRRKAALSQGIAR